MSAKTRWALYVLAFLCLPLFTATAAAECAWVLWGGRGSHGKV